MKEISKLFKNVDKLVFMSSSMGNSEMDWNYSGTGKTSVICEDNKIFFLDRITIDDRLSYEDKKNFAFVCLGYHGGIKFHCLW